MLPLSVTQVGRKTPWNTMEHAEIPSATRVVKGGEKGAPALGELLQGNGPIIGSVALPSTHALGRRYSYSYYSYSDAPAAVPPPNPYTRDCTHTQNQSDLEELVSADAAAAINVERAECVAEGRK